MKNSPYKKLYIIAYILLTIFVVSFFVGFTTFLIKIINYKYATAIICSLIVNLILFRDFAKLSALIVVEFSNIEATDDIPDSKVIRIKDYLKKKGRIK